ncbi:MAG: thiol-disulfide oxidoreductase DCC family protein [Thiobacillus sp.]
MTPDIPSPQAEPDELTLYYDGGCPVCTREIGFYQRRRGADRINWVNLAACDDAALGSGLSRTAAYARLHARLPDGTLLSGARAFAALWQALPAFRFAGRAAALPGVVHGLEIGYRGFLRLRRLWRRNAGTCPLPGKDRPN